MQGTTTNLGPGNLPGVLALKEEGLGLLVEEPEDLKGRRESESVFEVRQRESHDSTLARTTTHLGVTADVELSPGRVDLVSGERANLNLHLKSV